MSMTNKDLQALKKALGRGGYKKIAVKLNCSEDWVGKVLRDTVLTTKHVDVAEAAVEVIKENKAQAEKLTLKIREVLK